MLVFRVQLCAHLCHSDIIASSHPMHTFSLNNNDRSRLKSSIAYTYRELLMAVSVLDMFCLLESAGLLRWMFKEKTETVCR